MPRKPRIEISPNIDRSPKLEALEKLFQDINDMKERNRMIFKATAQGYS